MKKGRKRRFVALAASLVLLVTVPLMAAFAGEGDAPVSGSDVSGSDAGAVQKTAVASTVSGTDAGTVSGTDTAVVAVVSETDAAADQVGLVARAAAPKDNAENLTPEEYYGLLLFWWGNDNHIDSSQYSYKGYDSSTSSIKFTAPNCSNSMNTFLYWRDQQNGRFYYPGKTYSLKISDMEPFCVREDGWYSWQIKAVWKDDVVAFETDAWIQYDIPTDSDDPLEFDGFNKYYAERGSEKVGVAKGTYNVRTGKATFSSGYNKIQVSTSYIPKYKNYTFTEWNTKSDGTGKSYHPGDTIDLNQINDSGIILYGIFNGYTTKRIVSVTKADWGTDYYEYAYLTYNENGVISKFTAPAALKNSKNTFVGWRNTKTDEIYTPGKTYTNLQVSNVAEKNAEYAHASYEMGLESVWKGNELAFETTLNVCFEFEDDMVTYDLPASGIYYIDTGKCKYQGDPTFKIPTDQMVVNHDGFRFIGWNTSEYGNGTMFQPGDVIHFNRLDGYRWLSLYPTYETDKKFEVVVEQPDVTNFVSKVEPTTSLVLVGDVDFNEVRMVVANVENQNKQTVLNAITQKVKLKDTDGKPNVQMLDLKLVDSQNHDVSVESGKIKMLIDYPNIPNAKSYNYAIYHYKNNVAERVPVEKLDNCLVFYVDSFSPYALIWSDEPLEEFYDTDEPTQPAAPSAPQVPVETPKSGDSDSGNDSASVKTTGSAQTTESPSTGDNFSPVIFIVLLIVAAAAAGTVLVLRSRKSKDEEQADA